MYEKQYRFEIDIRRVCRIYG